MKKEHRSAVTDYVGTLNDDDVFFVAVRLKETMPGDLPDALDFMSETRPMDEILGSARNSDEFYNMLDGFYDAFSREAKRRNIFLGR
jgi:hypothetical protein